MTERFQIYEEWYEPVGEWQTGPIPGPTRGLLLQEVAKDGSTWALPWCESWSRWGRRSHDGGHVGPAPGDEGWGQWRFVRRAPEVVPADRMRLDATRPPPVVETVCTGCEGLRSRGTGSKWPPVLWDRLVALGFEPGSCNPDSWAVSEIERLRGERDEARAEVARLPASVAAYTAPTRAWSLLVHGLTGGELPEDAPPLVCALCDAVELRDEDPLGVTQALDDAQTYAIGEAEGAA